MKNVLADRLRELRGSMSQSDFAAKIGVKQTSYSSWERGVKDPLAQTLVQISNTLGVSADWLLGLSDERGLAQTAAPVAPPRPIAPKLTPDTATLMQQINDLTARVKALETQPSFACG